MVFFFLQGAPLLNLVERRFIKPSTLNSHLESIKRRLYSCPRFSPLQQINPFRIRICNGCFSPPPQLVLAGSKTLAPQELERKLAFAYFFSASLVLLSLVNVVDSPPLALAWPSSSFGAFYGLHERVIMNYFTNPSRAFFAPSWSKQDRMVRSANQFNEALWPGKRDPLHLILPTLLILTSALWRVQEIGEAPVACASLLLTKPGDTF